MDNVTTVKNRSPHGNSTFIYIVVVKVSVSCKYVSYSYLVPIDYLLHLIYKYHIESTIDAIAQVLYRDLVAVLVVTLV